ncbi:aspartate:alanine exchanger family transporter [Bradyrhizobium oligotrophicum S58]
MQSFFTFLQHNPYLLLFFVVGMAVWIGRASIKGYGLGMVAGAIVVGAGLSVWASVYGVKLELNTFAKSLFYYLFMYGVGLRVGPSFINSLRGDGLKFCILAVVSSVLGLTLVVLFSKLFSLPIGAAGGMLAGSQTMSAAIGSAEQAITSGVVKLPEGMKPEDASGMIALSYGITYIWGTVGIILICKYLPRWWGVDAKTAAKQYEEKFGVKDLEGGGLTGFRQFGLRAYRLDNPAQVGTSIAKFRATNPEYRVVNVVRNGEPLGAGHDLVLQKGDVIALGGATEHLTDKMGLIGPEVADAKALGVPWTRPTSSSPTRTWSAVRSRSFRDTALAGQLQVTKVERGGVPFPAGLKTELQRMDIISVVGLKSAVTELGEMWGRIARTNTSTDLLTLAAGMILGFLIGMIEFPAFGAKVGLGNAGGLLLSGVIVSSMVSRLRFFGNTPNAARNVLEDLGLVVFVAIVGVNAGAGLLAQLTGAVALKIFVAGFIACTIPPFVVWAIGYHIFRINPAVLMGGVAGARSHSGPCREAAVEIQSSVPWIGFPVGYAVSGILLTVFGYFAMLLAQ